MKALKIAGMVIGGLGFFALTAFVVSLILSLLWNWLMPMIFGLPEISLLQAGGIFILSKMIFTPGFGKGKDHSKSQGSNKWKERFSKKMADRNCCGEVVDVDQETDLDTGTAN